VAQCLDIQASSVALEADARFPVDTSCYPLAVIYRTCYAFTDRAYLWIEPNAGSSVTVSIKRKSGTADIGNLVGDFANQLIDFAVRHTVQKETASIRNAIVQAALSEAVGHD